MFNDLTVVGQYFKGLSVENHNEFLIIIKLIYLFSGEYNFIIQFNKNFLTLSP